MAFRDTFADNQEIAIRQQTMDRSFKLIEELSETMHQVAANANRMCSYRVYLLGPNSSIEAAENFFASKDAEAVGIADTLYAACCDVFGGYELWRGRERVDHPRTKEVERGFDAAIQDHQTAVAELEEKMQRAFACVGRSRKLVATYNRIMASRRTER